MLIITIIGLIIIYILCCDKTSKIAKGVSFFIEEALTPMIIVIVIVAIMTGIFTLGHIITAGFR